ncbi:MAG: lysophospholipase [Acetobacteraceae bacterium]|nr:lysophospholipase [Acetobacteraceae bacterium]
MPDLFETGPAGWALAAAALVGTLGLALFLGALGATWRQCYRVSHPPRVASGRDPSRVGLPWEPFAVRTRDGKRLSGWLIPPPGEAGPGCRRDGQEPGGGQPSSCGRQHSQGDGGEAGRSGPGGPALVVMCHFLGGGKESLLRHGQYLWRAGFGVALFDFRCHGQSQGYPFWRFKLDLDLEAVLDHVLRRFAPHAPRLAVMGLSMGASAAVLVAARRPEVQALVLDSGPLVLARDYFDRLFSLTGLPAWPCHGLFCALFLGLGGFQRLSHLVRRAMAGFSPRPALFIHGERDQVITRENSDQMFELLDSPGKEYWRVPGSYHLTAYALHPQEYAGRVVGFLQRALAPAGPDGRGKPASAGAGPGPPPPEAGQPAVAEARAAARSEGR